MEVILMRGMTGAGKSTYGEKRAEDLTKNGFSVVLFSADYFHMKQGKYCFDPLKIGEAHADCYRRYVEHVQRFSGPTFYKKVAIVDNTNISSLEIAPYYQLANAYGVPCEVRTIWCEPAVAAKRCIHGVPSQVILSLYQRLLREEIPPFYKHTVIF
jgi:tRNA uridine 5-carbamoylmethylation protein Kti12